MSKTADHKEPASLSKLKAEVDQLKTELRSAHDELHRTNSELVQLTLELEDRVEERTHELRQSKEELAQHRDHLQELVEERTVELSRVNAELKERLLELKASEERFRSLVVTIPDIVYRIDEEGSFTFVNAAIKRLGYEPHELIGKHFSEIIWPPDVEAVSREKVLPQTAGQITGPENTPKLFDERRSGKRRTCGLEVRLRTKHRGKKDGLVQSIGTNMVIVEVNSAGMYGLGSDAAARVFIGTVGVIRDITDRKQTENKILRQRAALEGINRVFRASLTGRTKDDLARVCLNEALILTESSYGIICEIDSEGQLINLATSGTVEPGRPKQAPIPQEFQELLRSVVAAGEPEIIRDYPEIPASRKLESPWPAPPLMVVPMKQVERTIGLIGLADKCTDYDHGDLNDVETLAAAFVESLMRQKAEQELGRRVGDLSALNAMANIANLSLNVEVIAKRALAEVRNLVDSPSCGIMLLDEKNELLVLVAGYNVSHDFLQKGGRLRLGQGVAGNVASSGEPTIIGDLSKFDGPLNLFAGIKKVKSLASIPLLGPDGVIGVMCLGGGRKDHFDQDMVELLKALGRQVAIGITKARLYEKQQDAAAIIAAERSAKDTINAMGDGLILMDNRGVITFINPAFETLTGYSRDELRGKENTALIKMLVSSDDLAKAAQALESIGKGQITPPLALHFLARSGVKIPVLMTMSIIKSIRGEPTSTVMAVKDITELRKAQESLQQLLDELQRQQAQLVEAEKVAALGTMTAGVAHELNNPMMGLLNYVQYCLKHTEPGTGVTRFCRTLNTKRCAVWI